MTLTPVTTTLEHQAIPTAPLDLFALAEDMRTHAGPDFSEVVDRLWQARDTIDQTLADINAGTVSANLLDLEPDQVAAVVRAACHDRAATMTDSVGYSATARVSLHLAAMLEASAHKALRPHADDVTTKMRPQFAKLAAAIQTAAELGLSEHTDDTDLLVNADAKQLAAYRSLPETVRALDQIAHLRTSMRDTLHYGELHEALSFVTGIDNPLALQGVVNVYAHPVEWQQYHQPVVGAALVQVKKQRLGGRWLALAVAGYTLRLNTADEAAAVHAAAYSKPTEAA